MPCCACPLVPQRRNWTWLRPEDLLGYGDHELLEPGPADVEPKALTGRDVARRAACWRLGQDGVDGDGVPGRLVTPVRCPSAGGVRGPAVHQHIALIDRNAKETSTPQRRRQRHLVASSTVLTRLPLAVTAHEVGWI